MRRLLLCVLISFFLFSCGGDNKSSGKRLYWSNSWLGSSFDIQGIACGDNGSVFAVGKGGYTSRSEDGRSWRSPSRISANGGTVIAHLNDITYCNRIYMIAGDNHTILFSTDQGTSWTRVTPDAFFNIDYYSIACTGSTFLAGGRTTVNPGDPLFDNRTAVSTNNGTNWTTQPVSQIISDNNSLVGVNHLVHSGGHFWLATDGDLMGYSSNGTSWNVPITKPTNANFNFTSMAFGEIKKRKVGMMGSLSIGNNASGRVIFNSDNISSWHESSLPDTNPVYGVAYGKDMFVALTDNMSYITDNISDDNTSLIWETDNFPMVGDDRINTFTYCGGSFWVGTDRGQIARAYYQ